MTRPIVFAKTDWIYDSYKDLWRLVELAGFEVCRVSEIDLERDACYITSPFSGETRQHLGHRRATLTAPARATVVWWNLERPDSEYYEPGAAIEPKVRGQTDAALEFVDRVWVSDRHMATLDPRQQFVILGSDARLAGDTPPTPLPIEYDVIHLSYLTHRRKLVYDALAARGLRIAPGGWGDTRDTLLRSSRVMLNVHQTPAPVGEPLRFALAAAYRLPTVTETLADPYPLDSFQCIGGEHARLVEIVTTWVRSDPSVLEALGLRLHHTLCIEHPFRQEVERGVHEAHRDLG